MAIFRLRFSVLAPVCLFFCDFLLVAYPCYVATEARNDLEISQSGFSRVNEDLIGVSGDELAPNDVTFFIHNIISHRFRQVMSALRRYSIVM